MEDPTIMIGLAFVLGYLVQQLAPPSLDFWQRVSYYAAFGESNLPGIGHVLTLASH